MSDQKTAYPLSWPDGSARTARHLQRLSAFGTGTYHKPSMAKAVDALQRELNLLKASDCILSTNIRRNLSGVPMSGAAQPADVGAAVYFKLDGKDVALPCDKWNRVECNVYAIAKHIEALRGQERWGVGNVEQAFRGYMALPGAGETGGDNPWQVLGVSINVDEAGLKEAYRAKVKKFHPDNTATGSVPEFRRIQAAYDMLAQNLTKKAA